MKKERLRKVVTVLTIIAIMITLISVGFHFLLPKYLSCKYNIQAGNADSIGIIGGADGPTAIFVASGTSSSTYILTAIFALLSIGGILYVLFANKAMK